MTSLDEAMDYASDIGARLCVEVGESGIWKCQVETCVEASGKLCGLGHSPEEAAHAMIAGIRALQPEGINDDD